MVFHTLPTARSFTLHHFFMHPDRSSMHFHALPPLFHRSSIALPSFFHHRSSRMGLRLILRGGGCNRAPPLLFSRSPLAHQHQHPTASLDSILQSSSFVRLVIVVPPSRSVSRLVSSRSSSPFVITSLSSSFRSFVRSSPPPWTAAPVVHQRCVLCRPRSAGLPRHPPASAALLAVCTHASVRTPLTFCRSSTLCVVPSKPPPRNPYTFLVRSLRAVPSYSGSRVFVQDPPNPPSVRHVASARLSAAVAAALAAACVHRRVVDPTCVPHYGAGGDGAHRHA